MVTSDMSPYNKIFIICSTIILLTITNTTGTYPEFIFRGAVENKNFYY